jgi:Protein of unknown function (DUF3667)
VSHIPQRKEKDCLNCGTIVQGHYCQNCGQENVVPHETFWHMVKHFLYDITHFDSKFFDSMKYLLFKPGFLPGEYIKGKRASYLNPVKKYVFTSAIFFLLFFSFFVDSGKVDISMDEPLSKKERLSRIEKAEDELQLNSNNDKMRVFLQMLKDTSRVVTQGDLIKYWDDLSIIKFGGRQYKNLAEYDSVQKALSPGERDGFFVRMLQKKNLKIREKYGNDPRKVSSILIDSFLHKLPYLLFASLPIFALILKLLYVRRKNMYYVDHGIFSLYHYIFTFFLLLVVFLIAELQSILGIDDIDFLMVPVFLSGGLYLYLAMKRFYKQNHGKTLLKFILLNIAGLLMMLILFTAFIFLSVFEI